MLGVSFLNPLALILFPLAAGILIYSYFKRARSKQLLIPSLFLFEQIQNKPLKPQSIKLSLRFFLELLTILLIVLFLAGLFLDRDSPRIAIVIDNPLSSAAVAPSTQEAGRTALSEIQLSAKEFINSLNKDVRFDIFTTSPVLQKLNQRELTPPSAISEIDRIKTEWAQSDLMEALTHLSNLNLYSEIKGFSLSKRTGSISNNSSERIGLTSIYSDYRLENVAITDIRSSLGSDSLLRLEVALSAYTDKTAEVELEVQEVVGSEENLNFKTLQLKPVSLNPNQTQSLSFDSIPTNARLRVLLRTTNPEQNAITLDDTAWFVQERPELSFILVSPEQARDTGLEDISRFNFRSVSPQEYEQGELEGIFLFHRYVPEILPESSAIYIAPPNTAPHFVSGRTASSPKITFVNQNHQLLQYLNSQLLDLKNISTLRTPTWAEDLVKTESGSGLFAGSRQGQRVVVTGFELLPFLGEEDPVLSILTLNMLNWVLGEATFANDSFRPFELIRLPEGIDSARDHTGRTYSISENGAGIRVREPGLLMYQSQSEIRPLAAVNAFYPTESNLLVRSNIIIPKLNSNLPRASQRDRSDWWHYFLYLLLLLLSLDLLLFELRKREVQG